MRKVYALGESLLDVIYKNGDLVAKKVGGSMLNASASLAKSGLSVYLISELGMDAEGDVIRSFLSTIGINNPLIYNFSEGNTAIARAILDDDNNANYTFEKNYSKDRLKIHNPQFDPNDILLFGSIYAIDKGLSSLVAQLLASAIEKQSLIFYDPNIRKTNLKKGDCKKVIKNMKSATIIRASNEDIENVFEVNDFDNACLNIPEIDKKIFIYTCAENGVYIHSPKFKIFIDTPELEVVSTIGAGDSFNAGLIYALIKNDVSKDNILEIGQAMWNDMIAIAIDFASDVCMSYDNYISDEFAKGLI